MDGVSGRSAEASLTPGQEIRRWPSFGTYRNAYCALAESSEQEEAGLVSGQPGVSLVNRCKRPAQKIVKRLEEQAQSVFAPQPAAVSN